LAGNSKDLIHLRQNVEDVFDFLKLIEKIDSIPQVKTRLHEENRSFYSLYKVVAEGVSPHQIEKHMIGFFGAPVKRSGEKPSLKLKFHPSLKLMGRILPEQTFFIKKLKKGEFFAAIWPWTRKKGFLTVHMGYFSKTLTDDDFNKLEDVVRAFSHDKLTKEMGSGISGQIRGINLPTFLQMSEQDKSTCVLVIKTKNKTGYLFMDNGELVDAETGSLSGREAAFEILKWDSVIIEIEKYSLKRENVIQSPLLNLLLEGLKQKDEEDARTEEDLKASGENGEPLSLENIALDLEDKTSAQHGKTRSKSVQKKQGRPGPYDDVSNKPFRKYVFVSVFICLAIGAAAWGSLMGVEYLEAKKQYSLLVEQLEKEPDLARKETMLNNFIVSRNQGAFSKGARDKLLEIQNKKDDAFYKEILEKVKALPLTDDYDVKAKELYDLYLGKFPLGKNTDNIKKNIEALPEMVEESQYKKLVATLWESKEKKIDGYKQFLHYHPQGKHREEVELFLVLEIEEQYEKIQQKRKDCDMKEDWTPCIEQCDRFLSLFEKTYRTDELKQTRDSMRAARDLKQLHDNAKNLEPDHRAIKNLYADYLLQNPGSPQKEEIQKEIANRQKLMEEADHFRIIRAASNDAGRSFIDRIRELDQYIDQDPTGPYADEARKIRDRLRNERLEYDRKNRMATERRRQEATLQLNQLGKQQQTAIMNREILNIKSRLGDASHIYAFNDDGTFTDKRTGLTWCVLDSTVVLGKCLNYDEALQYVNSLTTGGKTRWRLPTFSELAGIYKQEPFFPSESSKWFWTIEKVIKGYHEMVGIVTAGQETVFQRQYVPVKECGAVHAVHQ
jgi:hypothetical protein